MRLLVRPYGRELEFKPGENLLEVLLREGIPVSYSCRAGRCGTCRCSLHGATPPAVGLPFVRGAQEVLACRTTLVDDCIVEIDETDEIVVHPAKILRARVISIQNATDDIRILTLKPNKPLSYTPGQYAILQFSPEHIRPYSMASLPQDATMEFHVRVVPDGAVSTYIAQDLKYGDSVRISGPLGTSYWRSSHDGPVLCVAGGTGLAPVLAMLRAAAQHGHRSPVHLYFGVRSENDLYGEAWLKQLTTRLPLLQLQVIVANGPVMSPHRAGLVTDAIARDWGDLEGWRAYVCGAPGMVDAVSEILRSRNVCPKHIHADAFCTPPDSAVAENSA